MKIEKEQLKPYQGQVTERLSNHIVTMINFNWECYECKAENPASLSEEEDLCQTDMIVLTCTNCRTNNRVYLSDIYSTEP